MVHLVEHGLAGYVEDATRDDFADLAFAMHIDHLQRFFQHMVQALELHALSCMQRYMQIRSARFDVIAGFK